MAKLTTPLTFRSPAPSILDFYRLGRASLKQHPGHRPFTGLHAAADDLKINYQTLQRARVFAQLYSRQEVDRLCAHCRRHHNATIGSSHITRLATLPKARRGKLQRQAIKGGEKHEK